MRKKPNNINKTVCNVNKQDKEMFKLSEELRLVEESRLLSKDISIEDAFIQWDNIINNSVSCHKSNQNI